LLLCSSQSHWRNTTDPRRWRFSRSRAITSINMGAAWLIRRRRMAAAHAPLGEGVEEGEGEEAARLWVRSTEMLARRPLLARLLFRVAAAVMAVSRRLAPAFARFISTSMAALCEVVVVVQFSQRELFTGKWRPSSLLPASGAGVERRSVWRKEAGQSRRNDEGDDTTLPQQLLGENGPTWQPPSPVSLDVRWSLRNSLPTKFPVPRHQ
jgi:hypothetical protein